MIKNKINEMVKKRKFGIVMVSDEKYATYMRTAIKSIRKYNKLLPIHIYSCGNIRSLVNLGDFHCKLNKVSVPPKLKKSLNTASELDHASTRIAKLNSMAEEGFQKLMYLDCDIIAFDDIEKITNELKISNDELVVYLLLRRPSTLSISDISWLYFKNSSKLSSQQIADLVNDTFSTKYSAKKLQNIRCWNGGAIYGSAKAIHLLTNKWKRLYLTMLTGKNKQSFIPNDQLCLWLAIDQLENKIEIRELPLKWNFMPGHAIEKLINKTNPNPDEIKKSLTDTKILHLAQNKTDIWAQILINEVNSE